jgi:5-formyltetrahydrofolate cyclo-ligase
VNERDTEREQALRQRAKLALRKQMRAVRAALPNAASEARSQRIAQRVRALAEVRDAETILAFASIRSEVQTGMLIDAFHASGKVVALPRVIDDALVLHCVKPGDTLEEGSFSVPEPSVDAPIVDPASVELALVPALAVDPRGYRIGYGGGFYDRLLPQLHNARTCAVAFDFQLIAEVPELPFDEAVDIVVTDARVIRTR